MTEPTLSLARLKGDAKTLLRQLRLGAASASDRASAAFRTKPAAWQLSHAQFVLAREHGLESWAALKEAAEASASRGMTADQWLEGALSTYGAHPLPPRASQQIVESSPWAALAAGESALVKGLLKAGMKTDVKGGPKDWLPLHYLCFSRAQKKDALGTAKLLLDAGADPNASLEYSWNGQPNPLPVLYGAVSVCEDHRLADLLLKRGANPNDNESVYHSTEQKSGRCLKVLLDAGATLEKTNALARSLDYEHLKVTRMLLEAGFSVDLPGPQQATILHHAVLRGRSAAAMRLLMEFGADPLAPGHEGISAYELAVVLGASSAAQAMADGRSLPLSPLTVAVQEVLARRRHTITEEALAGMTKFHQVAFCELGARGKSAALRRLLKAGWPVNCRGDHGATALHWACWKGQAGAAEVLLEAGADTTLKDAAFQADPVGWTIHGSLNGGGGAVSGYASLVRAFRKAGVDLSGRDWSACPAEVRAAVAEG